MPQMCLLLGEGLGHTGQNSAPLVNSWMSQPGGPAAQHLCESLIAAERCKGSSREQGSCLPQHSLHQHRKKHTDQPGYGPLSLVGFMEIKNKQKGKKKIKKRSDCLGFEERCGQSGHLKSTSAGSMGFLFFFVFCTVIPSCPHANSQHRTPPSCSFILHIIVYCQVSPK